MQSSCLTSSALFGRGASSDFFIIFCLRLSLLAGRGLSSTSLEAERLAVGVLARAVRELEAILLEGCEAAWGWVMEDDEVRARTSRDVLGRALPAGGVGDPRASILCNQERDSGDGPLQLAVNYGQRSAHMGLEPAQVSRRCWQSSCMVPSPRVQHPGRNFPRKRRRIPAHPAVTSPSPIHSL